MSFAPPIRMPKAPARCGCKDPTHGHVVPCYKPKFCKDKICKGCQEGTTCTKDHYDKLGLCWYCKCELDSGNHSDECPCG